VKGLHHYIDRSLKALARRYPADFIRVVLGSYPAVTYRTVDNPEINLPERRLDFVYEVEDSEGITLLHLEFQIRHEPDLPRRIFEYNALLTAAHGVPAVSAVLYLERKEYKALPAAYTVALAEKTLHTFTYPVIRLWDYQEAILKGELRGLAPLLPLLSAEKDEAVLAHTKELILTAPDDRWRPEALSVAVTVAERYFDRDFLLCFFKEEIAMLREASIVQDWIREGMEKGMEKGRRDSLREAILDVLSERFGVIGPEVARKLEAVEEVAVLMSLHRRSLKVSSLAEFSALLDELKVQG